MALAEASPLGGVVDPATGPTGPSNEADQGAAILTTTSATGTLSANFIVPNPFVAGDPNAQCPPTQAQVNAGLTDCLLAIANITVITSPIPLDSAFLVYAGNPVPAAPTLHLSDTFGIQGDVLTVSDAASPTGYWWGTAIQGSPVGSIGATVGGTPASNTLTVSKAVYCASGATSAACLSKPLGTIIPPALSGQITVPAGTAGPANVVIDQLNETAVPGNGPVNPLLGTQDVETSTPFTYLGTPAIQVSPASGGNGVPLAVTGSNFDPQGGMASISFTSGTDTTTAVVQPNGSFSATLTVGPSEVASISPPGASSSPDNVNAAQSPLVGSPLTAVGTFTVLGVSSGPCPTVGGTGNGCLVNQVIDETVTGVTNGLIISEGNTSPPPAACAATGATNNADGIHLTLTPTTLNGQAQTAMGCLNTVRIEDARGTLVGWTTTGQLETDFLGPNVGSQIWDHVIPAQNLTWTPAISLTWPSAPIGPSGVLSEVAGGSTSTLPTASQATGLNLATGPYSGMSESSTPVDLCSAAPGGGGGTFNCDAGLALVVPAFVAASGITPYQSTIDLVVS